MLTREQRQQLEAEWSADELSIVRYARLLKMGVLSVAVLGLVWIAGTADRQETGQQAAAGVSITRLQSEGSAVRASRQVADERRAQREGNPAARLQQAASR